MTGKPSEVEESIRQGKGNAGLIEWVYREIPATLLEPAGEDEPDPASSIAYSIQKFREAGWSWNGSELTKDGWYIFYRSQGQLSPPIIQWQPRLAGIEGYQNNSNLIS